MIKIFDFINKKFYYKRKIALFSIILFSLSIVSFIFLIASHGSALVYYFHQDISDSFMDLFNSVAKVRYNYHLSNYPAMGDLPYKIMYCFVPECLWNIDLSNRENAFFLRSTIYGQGLLLLHFAFFIIPFCYLINSYAKKNNFSSVLLILIVILSGPFLFAFERANNIVYSFLFAFLFYCLKDSKKEWQRQVSFFSIALAVNIKLYPIFFCLIFLIEKRWKDIAYTFGYFLLLFFLPMLFYPAKFMETKFLFEGVLRFGGISKIDIDFNFHSYCVSRISMLFSDIKCIPGLVASYRGDSGTGLILSLQNILKLISSKSYEISFGDVISKIIDKLRLNIILSILFLSISILNCFFSRKSWIKWFSMTSIFVFLTGEASCIYILIFMTIPLFEYFASDDSNDFVTICFSVLFSLIMIPIKWNNPIYFITIGYLILIVVFIFLNFFVFIDTLNLNSFFRMNKGKLLSFFSIGFIVLTGIFSGLLVKKGMFDGTILSPYEISNKEDLRKLISDVYKGNSFKGYVFVQTCDIDLDNEVWLPIGIYESGKYFEGTYDGKYHSIRNINISGERGTSAGNVGMFGYLAGTVKNLTIESGYFDGNCVGSIASHGSRSAKIINCMNKASVNGGRAGGICDNFQGSVINCVNYGTINGVENGPCISYNASYVKGIEPKELPETFSGKYIEKDFSIKNGRDDR